MTYHVWTERLERSDLPSAIHESLPMSIPLPHATLISPPAPLALISHATRPEEKKLDLGGFRTPQDRDNRACWAI